MLKNSHFLFKFKNILETYKAFSEQYLTVQWRSKVKNECNAFIWFEEGLFILLFKIQSVLKPLRLALPFSKEKSTRNKWKRWLSITSGLSDIALQPTNEADAHNLSSICKTLHYQGFITYLKTSKEKG